MGNIGAPELSVIAIVSLLVVGVPVVIVLVVLLSRSKAMQAGAGLVPCPSRGRGVSPHAEGSGGTVDERAAAITSVIESSRRPISLPLPEELVQREFDLEKILTSHPTRGREMLARLFETGAIPVHVQPDGTYITKSRFFPLALLGLELKSTKPRAPLPEAGSLVSGSSRGPSPSCSSLSCAGRI